MGRNRSGAVTSRLAGQRNDLTPVDLQLYFRSFFLSPPAVRLRHLNYTYARGACTFTRTCACTCPNREERERMVVVGSVGRSDARLLIPRGTLVKR